MGGTLKALERLSGVPGRMDYRGVTNAGGALYVDYAHTPDGLATALSAARAHVSGKLHVVFGCGGIGTLVSVRKWVGLRRNWRIVSLSPTTTPQ